jgi:hypothetical protein
MKARLVINVAVVATVVGASFGLAATAATASTTIDGVRIKCTNTVTGRTFLKLKLPTTHIAPGTYTLGKVTCTVTRRTVTLPGHGTWTVHVDCVNTATDATIIDRNLKTNHFRAGVYTLGKVTCTITPTT